MEPTRIKSTVALSKLAEVIKQKENVNSLANAEMVQAALHTHPEGGLLLSCGKDVALVESGTSTFEQENYMYAKVPLGIILKGSVVVIKDKKATKLLTAGDFVGLFETSDWIQHSKSRHIGDWTLVANSKVEILFLPEEAIKDPLFREYLISLSRNDPVPQPLTDMPLLDWVAVHTTHTSFSEYAIIAHTHLLPSNMPLFRHLAHLVGPQRMFVMEKPYSTTPSVVNDLIQSGCEVIPVKVESGTPYAFAVQKSIQVLWDSVIEEYQRGLFSKLLILDDGGDVWLSIPFERLQGVSISGVEQTQRGTTRIESSIQTVPAIISVASSGVKKLVESDFIGRSVVLKLKEAGHIVEGTKIGVIGAGSIGNSVIETAVELGYETYVYDPIKRAAVSGAVAAASLDSLLNLSDLIIGTTGTNALRGVAINRVSGKKKLASASSADIEFSSLLRIAPIVADPFGAITIKVRDDLEFEILNGGFPFNFDRLGNAAHEEDIVLTRALLYAGMMQARDIVDGHASGGLYDLDIDTQRYLLEAWLSEKESAGMKVKEEFKDVESVINATFLVDAKKTSSVWR
jgi:hypothetical protein